jgi:hypothetical protein
MLIVENCPRTFVFDEIRSEQAGEMGPHDEEPVGHWRDLHTGSEKGGIGSV